MKAPANFNTGATRKITKTSSSDLNNAIKENFQNANPTGQQATVAAEKSQPAVTAQAPADTGKKETKDTKERFIITMAKGERSLFKSFCALKEVSMNHFVICAMDYFKEEVENGNVLLTPHGYKRQTS